MRLRIEDGFGVGFGLGLVGVIVPLGRLLDSKRHYANASEIKHLDTLNRDLLILKSVSNVAGQSGVSRAWSCLVAGLSRVGLDRFAPSAQILTKAIQSKEQEIVKSTKDLERVCKKRAIISVAKWSVGAAIVTLVEMMFWSSMRSIALHNIEQYCNNSKIPGYQSVLKCMKTEELCNGAELPEVDLPKFPWIESTAYQKVGYLAELVEILDKAGLYISDEYCSQIEYVPLRSLRLFFADRENCKLSKQEVFDRYLQPLIGSKDQCKSLAREVDFDPLRENRREILHQANIVERFLNEYCLGL